MKFFRWHKKVKRHHPPHGGQVHRRSVSRLNVDRELETLLPPNIPWKRPVVASDLFLRKEPFQASRKLSARQVLRDRWERRVWRLPLIGLRSQVRTERMRQRVRDPLGTQKALKDQLRQRDGSKTVCERRAERREQLFKMGIAGKNVRKSPGQGGHYRRTDQSDMVCRKVRT